MTASKPMPIGPRVQHRVCWSCERVSFVTSSPGYSEWTPGDAFALSCSCGYWVFESDDDGLDDFRRKLESAETCADFSPRGDQP